ncbi:hypothetical protein CY35_13G055100 [Sphagnum magellanicum]|nr:hypothetical protein CY35_13G055100 [Sphagnum magellanicum]
MKLLQGKQEQHPSRKLHMLLLLLLLLLQSFFMIEQNCKQPETHVCFKFFFYKVSS